MTARTAVRRSTVLGLGAVAALLVAAPAQAQDAGSVLETATGAVTAVVDPLTTPLQQAAQPVTDPVAPVVEQATAPVQQAVGTLTGTSPAAGQPPTVTTPPAAGGGGQNGTPQETPAPQGTGTPAGTGGPAPAAAAATGGTGVAAMPNSFTGSTAALEGFTGRGAGFGTATNPMSLFGAPQVAQVPTVSDLPTPLAITPAGASLADVLPVSAPDALPTALVAIAFSVVAGTAVAHVAVARQRATAASA